MSRNWQSSNLRIDEELRISPHLFIGGDSTSERVNSIRYLGETETGILVKCEFKPSIKAMDPTSYKMFISWASIWSGHVKIYSGDGSRLIAKRKKGQPIAYEVNME